MRISQYGYRRFLEYTKALYKTWAFSLSTGHDPYNLLAQNKLLTKQPNGDCQWQ